MGSGRAKRGSKELEVQRLVLADVYIKRLSKSEGSVQLVVTVVRTDICDHIRGWELRQ